MKNIIVSVPVYGLKEKEAIREGEKHRKYVEKFFPKKKAVVLFSGDRGAERLEYHNHENEEQFWKLTLPTIGLKKKIKENYIKTRTTKLKKELSLKKNEKFFVVESTDRGEISIDFL